MHSGSCVFGAHPDKCGTYTGHADYDDCMKFCELWDQTSFDPDYDSLPTTFFTGMTRQVFTHEPYDLAVNRTANASLYKPTSPTAASTRTSLQRKSG